MLTTKQRDDWADALESGQYEQAYATLYTPGRSGDPVERFCCLGVLQCTLGKRDDVIIMKRYPTVLNAMDHQPFMRYNDSDKLTFPQIAVHVRALPVSDGQNLDER